MPLDSCLLAGRDKLDLGLRREESVLLLQGFEGEDRGLTRLSCGRLDAQALIQPFRSGKFRTCGAMRWRIFSAGSRISTAMRFKYSAELASTALNAS